MPNEFFEEVKPFLPPEKSPGPRGGRPPIGHWIVLKVIWFVLVTGCRWEDVPLEMGCSGRTAHRRLRAWEAGGIWDRLHLHLLTLLRKAGQLDLHTAIIDGVQVRLRWRRGDWSQPRGPRKTRLETHVDGRSPRYTPGDPHGGSECQ